MIIKTIDNFLTHEDCRELILLIDSNNKRSSVAGEEKNTRIIYKYRTSNTSFLPNNNSLVKNIKQKISQELKINIENIETLQGVKYEIGQYFNAHHDAYEGIRKENLTKESGNRYWSFLIYLNDDFEGGSTNFPKLQYEITPKKGMALFWQNIRPNGDMIDESLHEGKLVLTGKKYVITTCIREKKFTEPSIIGDDVNANENITYLKYDT
jgi:prolyl 4-hydroxylase